MSTVAAISVVTELLRQAIAISQMVSRAQSEGRTELSKEEMDAVAARDDDARQALVDALKDAT